MSLKEKIGSSIINAVSKTFGVTAAARMWLSGEDSEGSGKQKPTSPYAQVELVFICVGKLIDAIQGLPAVISDTNENIIESGPAYDLLFNNPALNFERLVTETVGHYALSRDVFWVFTESQGTRPKTIQVVSGTQMNAVTTDGTKQGYLVGWRFIGSGGNQAILSTEEVWQWKNFNPYDPFHGIGPATASKLSIEYSYAAALFNTSCLENGSELGPLLMPEGPMGPEQANLLRSQFEARHKGSANAKRAAVLVGIKDIKTIAQTMVEMQVSELSDKSDAKICAAFGVPPQLVGLKTEAQYSAGPAQRDFVFNTVIPLARLFAGQITNGLLARFYQSEQLGVNYKLAKTFTGNKSLGLARNESYRKSFNRALKSNRQLFCWFDADQHPTVQEAKREIAEKVVKFTEAGIPLNQLIDAHDLPYEKVPWGDDWWVHMGLVPASYTIAAGPDAVADVSLPEGGEEELEEEKLFLPERIDKADDAKKLRIWKNWKDSWLPLEREYQTAMRKYFLRQQRELTTRLKKILGEKSLKDSSDIVARIVFDIEKDNGKLRVINKIFFEKATDLGIRQGLTESASLTAEELAAQADQVKTIGWLKGKQAISTHKVTQVNKTTKKLLERSLTEGLEKGEGLPELTQRVKNVTGKSLGRARSIARTQTAGAVSGGRQAGQSAAGVKKKAWIDSGDEEVRSSHRDAAVRYADGIPVDEPFVIGGSFLMYPADPAGPAAEVINCRCVSIAIKSTAAGVDLERYANTKFYSYFDMENVKNGS